MGITKEIPSQFQVDTHVNYRASIRYEINKDLNQYLSAYINRPLNYPPHNYIAKLVDNQIALPSNQMVEIVSFSFNPMFAPSFVFKMVMNDFKFQFAISEGFVDRKGDKVAIDYKSLKCLYIVEGEKGFLDIPHSEVIPEQLVCNSGIGRNNFFPKYVTIVANRA